MLFDMSAIRLLTLLSDKDTCFSFSSSEFPRRFDIIILQQGKINCSPMVCGFFAMAISLETS